MILWSAMGADDSLPDDVTTLKAMLRAERAARLAAEADAQAQILLIWPQLVQISCAAVNWPPLGPEFPKNTQERLQKRWALRPLLLG